MAWTIKKDFHGITAVNQKMTGAVEFREQNDRKFAVLSTKYDAFKMNGADMYQLGYMLIEMSGVTDESARELLEKDVNYILHQKESPLMSRVIELPKREDGCIDLGENGSISQYIRREETK